MKKTLINFNEKKKEGNPISWITNYNFWHGYLSEICDIDLVLIGDSGYNVEKGFSSTNFATMDGMIDMCQSVRRGSPNIALVGDMPSLSYEPDNKTAITNALRFIKEGNTDFIKLENATETILERIRAISDVGVQAIAHLGLCPQLGTQLNGYKCQGKTIDSFEDIYKKSHKTQEAGACMLLLEAMPELTAKQISKSLKIPVLGIGAGIEVDGQLLIISDLLGAFPSFRPYFAKCYIPEVINDYLGYIKTEFDDINGLKELGRKTRKDGLLYLSELAIKKYIKDVKERKFPDWRYTYPLKEEELNELRKSKFWDKNNE